MWRSRYRLRVILLSLGVVLGYGTAAFQFSHARYRHHHGEDLCWFGSHDSLKSPNASNAVK